MLKKCWNCKEDKVRIVEGDLLFTRRICIGKNDFLECNRITLKWIFSDSYIVRTINVITGNFNDNCIIDGKMVKFIKKMWGM